jgi:hypothetical protein
MWPVHWAKRPSIVLWKSGVDLRQAELASFEKKEMTYVNKEISGKWPGNYRNRDGRESYHQLRNHFPLESKAVPDRWNDIVSFII